ncbi:MAG: lytic transglycosylase domain-containing protein [bacterium JZ-2024 1]
MAKGGRLLFFFLTFLLVGAERPLVWYGEIYQALVKLQPELNEEARWKKAIEIETICRGLEVEVFLALAVAVKERELPEPAVDRRYKYEVQAILRGLPRSAVTIPSPWEDFLQLAQSLSDDLKEWKTEERALLAYFYGSGWLRENPEPPEGRKKFVEGVLRYAEELRSEILNIPKKEIPAPPKSLVAEAEDFLPFVSEDDPVVRFYQKWIRMNNPGLLEWEALEIARHILIRAREAEIPHTLVFALISVESRFNPRARSPKGARGLGQLMPSTASEMSVSNIYSIEENIRGSVAYLKKMLERYKNQLTLALAAYNAGPEAVDRYNGIPPYRETIQYVKKVLQLHKNLQTRLSSFE